MVTIHLNRNTIACCVQFRRQEAYCVPPVLLFEMNRTSIEADFVERFRSEEVQWLKSSSVDARVFLYYLHNIAYGGLCVRSKQVNALNACIQFIKRHHSEMYHCETALNLVGHCYEMDGNLGDAVEIYMKSRDTMPRNNAAN